MRQDYDPQPPPDVACEATHRITTGAMAGRGEPYVTVACEYQAGHSGPHYGQPGGSWYSGDDETPF